MEKLAISVPEAAKLLGISNNKMYELARSEGFPAFTVGARVLISAKGLDEWVSKQIGDCEDGNIESGKR